MARIVVAVTILLGVGVAGACSASTSVTSAGSAVTPAATVTPFATQAPAPTAEPTQPAPPPPTAAPSPTPPQPTATPAPTPTTEPTPTPEPTQPPTPVLFTEALEEVRALADLPVTGPPYDEFVDITDESGLITVTVPGSWSDIDRQPWTFEDEFVGTALSAATSLEGFRTAWGDAGMFIGASNQLRFADAEALLQDSWFGDFCDFIETRDYFDGLYFGFVDIYVNCGPEQSAFLQIAAAPEDNSYLIEAQLLAPTDQDLDAAFLVIESFLAEPG